MLHGRFGDTSGRPYIEGRLSIPDLKVSGNISFIVDTGADKSMLMPLDANRLKIDYSSLVDTVDTVGIGGCSKDFVVPALVAFAEPGEWLNVYIIQLRISSPSPDIANIPSLLGRDIIDNWTITYDKPNNVLVAEVRAADIRLPLGGSSSA